MVIVTNAILVKSSRTCWLNPPQQLFLNQHVERIVNGLPRDGAEFGPNFFGDVIGRAMRRRRHRAENRQALCSHLHSVFS
jgi:hypothetical protein